MAAFQQGMALGQSAVNAALDVKMQKMRDERIKQQLDMENQIRQEKMRIEANAMQSLSEGLKEIEQLDGSGKLTAESLQEIKRKYLKSAMASPQAANMWNAATQSYAQSESILREGEEKIAEQKLWDEWNELTAYEPKPMGKDGMWDREAARKRIMQEREKSKEKDVNTFTHETTTLREYRRAENNALTPRERAEAKKVADAYERYLASKYPNLKTSEDVVKEFGGGEPGEEPAAGAGKAADDDGWITLGNGMKVRAKK